MYFINEQHQQNYINLMAEYELKRGSVDRQYEANIYIASVPYIFDLIDLDKLNKSGGPLYHLMEWDEEKKKHVPAHPGLTGSTTKLLTVGLSLYNGYPTDLDYTYSREFANVIIQAIKIRNNLENAATIFEDSIRDD